MKSISYIIKNSHVKKTIIVTCGIMALLSSLLSLLPTQFLGQAISSISNSEYVLPFLNKISGSNYHQALWAALFFLVTSAISILFRNLFCSIVKIQSDRVINETRKSLFKKLLSLEYYEIKNKTKGNIIHTLLTETQKLEYLFSVPIYTVVSDILDILWISLYIFLLDPILLAILFSITPVLYVISIFTGRKQKKVMKNIQQLSSKQTTKLEQVLSGIEIVKSFNGETLENTEYTQLADESYKNRIHGTISLSSFFIGEGLLRTIGTTLVLAYVIYQIHIGNFEIGILAIMFQYSNRLYAPIRNITRYYQTVQSGFIAADTVYDFFTIDSEDNSITAPCDNAQAEKPALLIKDLTYSIENTQLFKNFNLTCEKGEFILIKGESGIGKSTLFRILLGLYKIPPQSIFINGIDISLMNKAQLRNLFSYSSQKVFIHNKDLTETVQYPNGTDEFNLQEISDLFKLLDIDSSIEKKAGEDGNRLSGGEANRISFIRSILRNKPIFLLDEILTGLDPKNQSSVINILKNMKGEKTIIMITHSDNTQLNRLADHIITL